MRAEDVLYFWFTEIEPAAWWRKDRDFDVLVMRRFLAAHEAAAAGELSHWRQSARGRLAEIILLDQMPRNMFRDTARAFATDGLALVLAQEAVRTGADKLLTANERQFLYLPFMHSESRKVQERSVVLYGEDPDLAYNLGFAEAHKRIIDQFGRYPHRNAILGRKSTEAEIEFLKGPGSSF